jgi:hypothetical protein
MYPNGELGFENIPPSSPSLCPVLKARSGEPDFFFGGGRNCRYLRWRVVTNLKIFLQKMAFLLKTLLNYAKMGKNIFFAQNR